MTRVNFNLQYEASNIEEAQGAAIKNIAEFLNIPESDVLNKVSLEFKVEYPEEYTGKFLVTSNGQVKNGFVPTPH